MSLRLKDLANGKDPQDRSCTLQKIVIPQGQNPKNTLLLSRNEVEMLRS